MLFLLRINGCWWRFCARGQLLQASCNSLTLCSGWKPGDFDNLKLSRGSLSTVARKAIQPCLNHCCRIQTVCWGQDSLTLRESCVTLVSARDLGRKHLHFSRQEGNLSVSSSWTPKLWDVLWKPRLVGGWACVTCLQWGFPHGWLPQIGVRRRNCCRKLLRIFSGTWRRGRCCWGR